MKMNLSKFKKISSDGKTTTMMHPSGHKIIISNQTLSPKMRGELAALPHFDGGGNVADNDVTDQNKAYLANKYPKFPEGNASGQGNNSASVQDAPAKEENDANQHELNRMTSGQSGTAPPPDNHAQLKSIEDAVNEYKGGKLKKFSGGGETAPTPTPSPIPPDAGDDDPMNDPILAGKHQKAYMPPPTKQAKGGQIQQYAAGTPDGGAESEQDSPDQIAQDAAIKSAPQQNSPSQQGQNIPVGQKIGKILGESVRNSPQAQALRATAKGAAALKGFASDVANGVSSGLDDPDAQNTPSAPQQNSGPVGVPVPAQQGGQQDTPNTSPADNGTTAKPTDPSNLPSDPYQAFTQGVNQQLGGIQEQAANAGTIGQQQSSITDAYANMRDQATQKFLGDYDALNTERTNAAQDLKNGMISPENYWNNHSKVMTGIGLILGGFGGQGTANFVNEMMNRDMEAQKANLGAKQSLLDANLKQFGNLQQATAMTGIMQRDALSAHLDSVSQKYAGTQAGAIAAQTSGQLKQQASGTLRQMAMMKTLQDMGNQPNAKNDPDAQIAHQIGVLRVMNPEAAKEAESRMTPGFGSGMGTIPLTPDDRAKLDSGVNFQQQMNRFINWTKTHSGDLNPADRNYGEALAAQLQGSYRNVTNGGVYKEGEQHFIGNVIDSEPTKFLNSVRVLPKLQAVQQESAAQLNNFSRQRGAGPYRGVASPQQSNQNYMPKSAQPIK